MIIQAIVDLLKANSAIGALVGGPGELARIYPEQLPDASTFPAVVVTKAAGVGDYTLDGDDGLENARVQIDSYAVGYAVCVELKTLIRRQLSGYKGGMVSGDPCAIQGAFCINDSDLSVSETERAGPRLRRRMLEFRIWNTQI